MSVWHFSHIEMAENHSILSTRRAVLFFVGWNWESNFNLNTTWPSPHTRCTEIYCECQEQTHAINYVTIIEMANADIWVNGQHTQMAISTHNIDWILLICSRLHKPIPHSISPLREFHRKMFSFLKSTVECHFKLICLRWVAWVLLGFHSNEITNSRNGICTLEFIDFTINIWECAVTTNMIAMNINFITNYVIDHVDRPSASVFMVFKLNVFHFALRQIEHTECSGMNFLKIHTHTPHWPSQFDGMK